MRSLLPVSLFIAIALPLAGQTDEASMPAETEESVPHDSIKVVSDSITADTVTEDAKEQGKSVRTAMLLSAFIPGGGQLYNESFWKGGLVAAAEITLASFTIREHLLMASVEEMWSDDVPYSIKGPKIDSLRNLHRDRRNVFAFFTGAVIAFAVSDAYVDAHMFGFKESQRLSLVPAEEGLGLALRYRF